jgi:dual specificity tyrosine-phosphorylation-regulated kinase 1
VKCDFVHRGHVCIVYELLSYNLYELLRIGDFAGISLGLIRKFSYQILKSLRFLSSDGVKIIHCDLKPEKYVSKGRG